ncbi:MAG: adenine deaminase [Kiritimatiellae bacterium]|nr:adenine deaminase [Kiritimatiellia bacterium]
MNLPHLLAAARGDTPCDLVIAGARVVNVLSAEIEETSVAVQDGLVVGLGDYTGRETVDAGGMFLAPGFIDAHIHIESTLLTLPEFARAVLPHGTVGVVMDPHEIANVHGLDGIRYMLECARHSPLDVRVMLPSCVPATPFESAAAALNAADLETLIGDPLVAGIGELMNFPGLLNGDPEMLRRAQLAGAKIADGHCPGLSGRALNAYILAGARTDHESTSADEAREKLRRGLHVHIREGSAEHNLAELAPLVTPANAAQCSFASDDRHPDDLMREGHLDHSVRLAIAHGLDPLQAYALASLNTAKLYRMPRMGAIAPGYQADFFLTESLEKCRPILCFKRGRIVAKDGQCLADIPPPPPPPAGAMRVAPLTESSFDVPAGGTLARVIELVPGQIVTRAATVQAPTRDGRLVADPEHDLLKIAVIERHQATGRIGVGLVRGFGLRRGAIAGTVAHDAHNLIVAGATDTDMRAAAQALVEAGGGFAVADGGRVVYVMPLPIAGLMSDQPLAGVVSAQENLLHAARALGGTLDNPFMTLSFLALTPIPSLKITDRGLFDASSFQPVSLFVE